jgi:hypothetical protein
VIPQRTFVVEDICLTDDELLAFLVMLQSRVKLIAEDPDTSVDASKNSTIRV